MNIFGILLTCLFVSLGIYTINLQTRLTRAELQLVDRQFERLWIMREQIHSELHQINTDTQIFLKKMEIHNSNHTLSNDIGNHNVTL